MGTDRYRVSGELWMMDPWCRWMERRRRRRRRRRGKEKKKIGEEDVNA